MSTNNTRFLYNETLWKEIKRHVIDAKRVRAAIAYFGTGGAKLLPLKKGDVLIVDLSLGAVHQGVTNPSELSQLLRRGVRVFSRGSLHAKFVIADKTVITSSANVSRNSTDVLDEAGIITTDPATLRRASDFFDQLCTEPVGKQYLRKCISEYRPPKFKAALVAPHPGANRSKRLVEAKVWFLGNLDTVELSEDAQTSIQQIERRATRKLKDPEKTEVRWIRYLRKPKFLRHIRVGDWVIDCMKDGVRRYVGPPTRVIGHDQWISPRGTPYSMLMLESPVDGETMTLGAFRNTAKRIERRLDRSNPRTQPIVDNGCADALLRLWTPTGKLTSSRTSK